MRDILSKVDSLRSATAEATLQISPETIQRLRSGDLPKGDPLPVAKTAALVAAKLTPQLIPYCHNVPIEAMDVSFEIGDSEIKVLARVASIYKTGVEMEALTAASIAALNIYDMLKIIDEDMEIRSIRLIEKKGGKSDFRNLQAGLQASVLVVSDSVSGGHVEDRSGKALADRLNALGLSIQPVAFVADEAEAIRAAVEGAAGELLLITGGTGLGPRDITPEVVGPMLERRLWGVEEAMRSYGQQRTPFAMLSRSLAGTIGHRIVLCFPGSTNGAVDCFNAIFPAVLHAVDVMKGGGH